MVDHPFDIAPELHRKPRKPPAEAHEEGQHFLELSIGRKDRLKPVPEVPIDVQTTAWMESHADPARREVPLKDDHVQTVAWTESQPGPSSPEATQRQDWPASGSWT